MTPDHLKRLADYLQAELKLVNDLSDLLPKVTELSVADRTGLDTRVQKFMEYKTAKLDRLKDEIVWGKEISDVLSKVGDLLLKQQVVDNQLKKRADVLYAQETSVRQNFTEGEIKVLTENYVNMELAQRQGEIFWFAAYTQKQIETLLNLFIRNLSTDEISGDLATAINFWEYDPKTFKSVQKEGKLVESLFTGSYENHTKIRSLILNEKKITEYDIKTFDFAVKLKYFTWRNDFKVPLRPFAYLFSPPQYLADARNIDSHGGNPANEGNDKKRKRLLEIQNNPAKFFILFQTLLHSVHKHIFVKYSSL